ncbi:hypothetical protein ACIQ6Y_33590 [Streptomyces sp. NPDC096205]|uniref:hypothetical protein n=1 Tax=Streptomyces sp. NPDC096205 TaxID=3366081 RepID=UPI0038029C57
MAGEPEGNTPLESVRETLERAVSDINRVLGLQGLRTGDDTDGPPVGFRTISATSIGCSTYSVACGTPTIAR